MNTTALDTESILCESNDQQLRWIDPRRCVILFPRELIDKDYTRNKKVSKHESDTSIVMNRIVPMILDEMPELHEMIPYMLHGYCIGGYGEPFNYYGLLIMHHGFKASKESRNFPYIYLGKKENHKLPWREDYTPVRIM